MPATYPLRISTLHGGGVISSISPACVQVLISRERRGKKKSRAHAKHGGAARCPKLQIEVEEEEEKKKEGTK